MIEGQDLASPVWSIWAAESPLEPSELHWLESLQQPGDSLYSKVSLPQCPLSDSLVTHLLPTWQRVLKPFTGCFWFLHLHTSLSALHHPKRDTLRAPVFLSPDLSLQDSNQQKPEAGNYGTATAVLSAACR